MPTAVIFLKLEFFTQEAFYPEFHSWEDCLEELGFFKEFIFARFMTMREKQMKSTKQLGVTTHF